MGEKRIEGERDEGRGEGKSRVEEGGRRVIMGGGRERRGGDKRDGEVEKIGMRKRGK